MKELNNKKILFFAPDFFGYDIEIKKKLENFGAKVDLYNERPSSDFFTKAIIRLNKNLISRYIENYFDKIIKQNQHKDFDYIFIIKGEAFNPIILKKLINCYSKAKIILYLWDSIRNYKEIKQCFPLLNKILTFDHNDSDEYDSLIFRPLFFIEDYTTFNGPVIINSNYKYDLLFIGTIHSDRWLFLEKIKEEAIRNNLSIYYYPYIQSPIIFLFRKIFDKRLRTLALKEVKFKPISKSKIIELTRKSKAILDIQHPEQTGLTMRTLEVFGSKRKLITTNESIKTYDLYSPDNILVVDRKNPCIQSSFWETNYSPLPLELYGKYSINGWLQDIFRE